MNPLSMIGPLLPLLILPQFLKGLGGASKPKPLTHSPGRNAAKITMGALACLGGVGSAVAAPIVLAVVRPAVNVNDATVTTLPQVQANQADWNRATYAATLTGSISAGAGLVAAGVGAILGKA